MHVASPTSCMYLFSRNLFLKFLFGRKEIPFPYILQISFRFGISFQSYFSFMLKSYRVGGGVGLERNTETKGNLQNVRKGNFLSAEEKLEK